MRGSTRRLGRTRLGMTLIALVVGALAVSTATPAFAQQTLTGYTGPVKLQGSISGSGTATVRAYVNGLRVSEVESSATGSYEVGFELDGAVDQTAVVWFLPDDTTKVPEIVVLKEGSSARRNGIWSPCLTRVTAKDIVIHNVTFVTQKELFKRLEESDCWDE